VKALAGWFALALLVAGASAQTVTRGFGSVVFPGGTSATTPGVTRNFGSVVFPGGAAVPTVRTAPNTGMVPGVVHVARPAAPVAGQNFRRFQGNRVARPNTLVYAYPVFIGGGYGGYDAPYAGGEPAPPAMAPPAMTMYPPETARPVMIQVAPDNAGRQPMPVYTQPEQASAEDQAPAGERYLLAFKDHTIYSAVAYWFDGDTLHYFTSGSMHNQVSVSLVDRDLTLRLNKELGIDFHMPAAK
jgi:hypothetical protein